MTRTRKLIMMLRQLFCRHVWKELPYRALVADPGVSYTCKKCGKWKHEP